MDFIDAIFLYESESVPAELKVMREIAAEFSRLPDVSTTLVHVAHSIEQAVPIIEQFKVRTCCSPYSLAVINLNMMNNVEELQFLMQQDVLGDPRTIFLASLRFMVGDTYTFARDKVQREAQPSETRATSCLDCYAPSTRNEVFARVSHLMAAYLREADELAKARSEGGEGMSSKATELMRKSHTVYFGGGMKSGLWKSVNKGVAGRFSKTDSHPGVVKPVTTTDHA